MARTSKPSPKTKSTLQIPLPQGISAGQKTALKILIPIVLALGAWLTDQLPGGNPLKAQTADGTVQTQGQSSARIDGKSYTGKVVKVADGDTLTVVDKDGLKHKIRMHGIDAPESKQAHGKASGEWMSARVLNTTVMVEVSDTDRYQREVAKVWVTPSDCREANCQYSQDINLEALKAGQVWWYKAYAKTQSPQDRKVYEEAETLARQARLGIWSGPKPQPPWEWRAEQRQAQN